MIELPMTYGGYYEPWKEQFNDWIIEANDKSLKDIYRIWCLPIADRRAIVERYKSQDIAVYLTPSGQLANALDKLQVSHAHARKLAGIVIASHLLQLFKDLTPQQQEDLYKLQLDVNLTNHMRKLAECEFEDSDFEELPFNRAFYIYCGRPFIMIKTAVVYVIGKVLEQDDDLRTFLFDMFAVDYAWQKCLGLLPDSELAD